jgi:hypothetical protein
VETEVLKSPNLVLGFSFLALIDLGMNAGAGAAAAVVGARGNGFEATTLIVRTGAFAGLTKSAIAIFAELVSMVQVNISFHLLMILLTSSFGVCPLLVVQVCNSTLGQSECSGFLLS